MQFSIAFQPSGDTVTFNAVNVEMYEFIQWFADQLNNNGSNNFVCDLGPENDISLAVNNLHATLLDVNSFLGPLVDRQFEIKDALEDYTNSNFLNKLHAEWANLPNEMYGPDPICTTLIEAGVFSRYEKINTDLHDLEIIYRHTHYQSEIHTQMDNPFSTRLLTNHHTNFNIPFQHLGRCLYNKFRHGDYNLEWNDLNNFTSLFAKVQINMCTPESIPLSPEFIAWCHKHNKVPTGDRIAVGNIVDYFDNHQQIRKLLYRNLTDKFSITY